MRLSARGLFLGGVFVAIGCSTADLGPTGGGPGAVDSDSDQSGQTGSGGTSSEEPTNGGTTSNGGSPPAQNVCDAVECGNGQCVATGDEASCSCDAGWSGESCQTEVQGCEDAPCENGECTDLSGNNYSCACDAGWSGPNCDLNIDDCSVAPCANGECTDGVDSFTCSCDAGWEGETCSLNVDDCADSPCENGECLDDIDAFACSCELGWTGETCADEVNGCQDSPCSHGDCNDLGAGAYTCSCDAGWAGDNCDSCAADYVLEGGVCINEKQAACRDAAPLNASSTPGTVTITYSSAGGWGGPADCAFTCDSGWQGATCAESVDDCVMNECENGGMCEDAHQGYTCSCPSGFSGDLCETNVNDCMGSPCDHGTCQDGVDSYSCDCDAGWAGDNCDSCATNYAYEAGNCINEKDVSCVDAAPGNASSIPSTVTITYTTSGGWTTPAECDFDCDAGWTWDDCSVPKIDCTYVDNPAHATGETAIHPTFAGMVAIHNEYRARVGVDPVVWDAELAAGAQVWADNCQFEHSSNRSSYPEVPSWSGSIGENIGYAWSSSSSYTPRPVSGTAQAWIDERYDLPAQPLGLSLSQLNTQSTGVIGHYTQVVWEGNSASTHIGCGMATDCDGPGEIWDPGRYGHYVVCWYGPAGNYSGQRPWSEDVSDLSTNEILCLDMDNDDVFWQDDADDTNASIQ